MDHHYEDDVPNRANSADREKSRRATTGALGDWESEVTVDEEEFAIPIPTGLATMPRGTDRIWPTPCGVYSFNYRHHAALMEEVRGYRMRVRRSLYDWLRHTCTAGVRREYVLGQIEWCFPSSQPVLAQAHLTPVLVFADPTESAMFRLAWC